MWRVIRSQPSGLVNCLGRTVLAVMEPEENDGSAPMPWYFCKDMIANPNSPLTVTKEDIQEHFKSHGTGTITEVKLMNGFGFIEYDDAMDARDVVPGMLIVASCQVDC